jgi:hypothetical protein
VRKRRALKEVKGAKTAPWLFTDDGKLLSSGNQALVRVVTLPFNLLLDAAQGIVPHDVVHEFRKQHPGTLP